VSGAGVADVEALGHRVQDTTAGSAALARDGGMLIP
jgi:hypothetical protein